MCVCARARVAGRRPREVGSSHRCVLARHGRDYNKSHTHPSRNTRQVSGAQTQDEKEGGTGGQEKIPICDTVFALLSLMLRFQEDARRVSSQWSRLSHRFYLSISGTGVSRTSIFARTARKSWKKTFRSILYISATVLARILGSRKRKKKKKNARNISRSGWISDSTQNF